MDTAANSLLPLINGGAISVGQVLFCPIQGVTGVVIMNGLCLDGMTTDDLTEAMRHVLGHSNASDNGWTFWVLKDGETGITTPMERIRAGWRARQKPADQRTSETHPLRINHVSLPNQTGRIGMTICPGKKSDSFYGADWNRDLIKDIEAINAWGADAVVTLLEDHEFEQLAVPEFPEIMQSQSFAWHHLRISDGGVPDERFEQAWPVRKSLEAILKAGGSIVVHCRGGLGRTGLVVARYLAEASLDPDAAIECVRRSRPSALETWAQEEHVRHLPVEGQLIR